MKTASETSATLTELEGAILAEVERLAPCTAYQVRLGFRASRSSEWSASAGAVYPALKRLRAAGLVAAGPVQDARGGQRLSLTGRGKDALAGWLFDVERALGAGLDPFRTRAGFWSGRPGAEQRGMFRQLERALTERIAATEAVLAEASPPDSVWTGLELDLQRLRLAWLRAQTEIRR